MSDPDEPVIDPDQPAEAFDDELLDHDEFPPDRPLGVEPDDQDDIYLPEDEEIDEDFADEDLPSSQNPGPLAEDDEFTGDETTRDVATERVPDPAEEAALHVEPDEPPEEI